jgi:protein MAK16
MDPVEFSARLTMTVPSVGICYLYMKTIERAHTPAKLWEVIKLSENYKQALAQIDQHLQYWPEKLIHRNKQRLTKIWQYLIRMRRLRKKVRPTIITINQKVERREKIRERKALSAALVDQEIKKELLDRLKQVRGFKECCMLHAA